MRIDVQIPAHLRQQVVADFFLPILKGGEFFAEVQAAMAAFSLVGQKMAGDLLAPRQLLYAALEFLALHLPYSRTDVSGESSGNCWGSVEIDSSMASIVR